MERRDHRELDLSPSAIRRDISRDGTSRDGLGGGGGGRGGGGYRRTFERRPGEGFGDDRERGDVYDRRPSSRVRAHSHRGPYLLHSCRGPSPSQPPGLSCEGSAVKDLL